MTFGGSKNSFLDEYRLLEKVSAVYRSATPINANIKTTQFHINGLTCHSHRFIESDYCQRIVDVLNLSAKIATTVANETFPYTSDMYFYDYTEFCSTVYRSDPDFANKLEALNPQRKGKIYHVLLRVGCVLKGYSLLALPSDVCK
jgi:hypothetical protein